MGVGDGVMGMLWTAALNGGVWFAGALVAKYGLRQRQGWPVRLAAPLLGWGWLTVGMEAFGVVGLYARGPLLGWVAAGLVIGLLCKLLGRPGQEEIVATRERERWGWEEIVAGAMILCATALTGTVAMLQPVKVLSDGPIYHLYYAARWWKSGRLELIAAPFGENAAPYFPAVGDLWFTWLMIGWGGDWLARVGQFPFLILAGLTTFALCQRVGTGRPASFVATAWFVTCPPLFLFSFEANVDTIFVAGYMLAVYFFTGYALGEDGPASLALGALGAGLAVATKAPGIVFVPPLIVLGMALAVWNGKGIVGTLRDLAIVLLVPLTVAGFWWGRNAWLTGNPLYPLHLVVFGRVWLSGWYGPDVMRQGQYYIPVENWRACVDILFGMVDPRFSLVWLAAIAGAWALGTRKRTPADRWVWIASGLAVANFALFWLVVPYRTQYRFFYQALGLAAIPLARLLDRGRPLLQFAVVLFVIHMTTRAGWPFDEMKPPWDLCPFVPNNLSPVIHSLPTTLDKLRALRDDPWTGMPVLVTFLIILFAFASAWGWARVFEARSSGRVGTAVVATALLIGIAVSLGYPWAQSPRVQFFSRFEDYYRGWLFFDQRCGPAGARVAYAGNDLPYFLMGVGLRNEVRYVNVDEHRDWLMHDYHRAAGAGLSHPPTWPTPRPGWDRIHPNYDAWLANLRAERIQFLVVTRANAQEGAHNLADTEAFPIERVWADAHPGVFELLYGPAENDKLFRLYRLKTPSRTK